MTTRITYTIRATMRSGRTYAHKDIRDFDLAKRLAWKMAGKSGVEAVEVTRSDGSIVDPATWSSAP